MITYAPSDTAVDLIKYKGGKKRQQHKNISKSITHYSQ